MYFLCGIHRMPRFGDHGRLVGSRRFGPASAEALPFGIAYLSRPAGLSRVRHPLPAAPQPISHDMLRRPTVVRAGIGEARVKEVRGMGIDFLRHGPIPPPCGEGYRVGVEASAAFSARTNKGNRLVPANDSCEELTPTPTPPHKGEGPTRGTVSPHLTLRRVDGGIGSRFAWQPG